MKQQNRTRNVQLILRVTPQEYEHIQKKMALMKTHNFNAYARKMLIDGYVIEVDLSMYHELAGEVLLSSKIPPLLANKNPPLLIC